MKSSAAESIRTPATPRSNQKRSTSSCSSRTSSFSQLRSGCSGAKRCRYHSAGVPSSSCVCVQALPPKMDDQSFGGSSPCGPRPGRNQKRARSGSRGQLRARPGTTDADRSSGSGRCRRSHGCPAPQPRRSAAPLRRASRTSGRCRGSRRRRSRRRPSATDTRGEPDRVDPQVAEVRKPGSHSGEIADAVAVAVREAAHVDLVDDRATPPGKGAPGAGIGPR